MSEILCRIVGSILLLMPVPLLAGEGEQGTVYAEFGESFSKLRDTLFVLDSSFVEVRLDRQMIYQHFRSGRVDAYPCSTGDPRIPEGIATRPGIFTVRNKASRALSPAFGVYLNYWIGFDGGIGFHGLDGRSYYKYLGRRPSSHGCVRISNETGAQLFKRVRTGTIVYVHSGTAARVLAFAQVGRDNLVMMSQTDGGILERRLEAVEMYRWDDPTLAKKIAIPAGRRFTKIAIGRINPQILVQYPIAPRGAPNIRVERVTQAPRAIRTPHWLLPPLDDPLAMSLGN